jgi:hypothetical protein
MKTEKFQLCGNNSVWAGAIQLLCGRVPAQHTGNIALNQQVCIQYTLEMAMIFITYV